MNALLVEYHVVALSNALKEMVSRGTNPTQIGFLVPYTSYMAPEILQAVVDTFASYGFSTSRLDAPPRIHFVLTGHIGDNAAAVALISALPTQYTLHIADHASVVTLFNALSTQNTVQPPVKPSVSLPVKPSALEMMQNVDEFIVKFPLHGIVGFSMGRKFRSDLIVTKAGTDLAQLTSESDVAHLACKAAKDALDTAITKQDGVQGAAEKLTEAFRAHRLARVRRCLGDVYHQLVTMLEKKSTKRFVLLNMEDRGITEKGLNLVFARLTALEHTVSREPEEPRNTTARVLNLIVETPKEQILYVITRRDKSLDYN